MIERTLAIIKPDAVARKLTGKIIQRIDEAVKKIVKDPDYVKELAAVGNLSAYKAPSEMPAHVGDEVKILREVAASLVAGNK